MHTISLFSLYPQIKQNNAEAIFNLKVQFICFHMLFHKQFSYTLAPIYFLIRTYVIHRKANSVLMLETLKQWKCQISLTSYRTASREKILYKFLPVLPLFWQLICSNTYFLSVNFTKTSKKMKPQNKKRLRGRYYWERRLYLMIMN